MDTPARRTQFFDTARVRTTMRIDYDEKRGGYDESNCQYSDMK